MDDRGRFARPLKGPDTLSLGGVALGLGALVLLGLLRAWAWLKLVFAPLARRIDQLSLRLSKRVHRFKPRYLGVIASLALIIGAAVYGMVRGDHVGTTIDALRDARDAAANAAGFKIITLNIAGRHRLSESEVLAAAGVSDRTSLLFLNVDDTRRKLESSPWIARATVRKLYPGYLEIALTERDAYALWQHGGQLHVIGTDGTVLGVLGERKVDGLPLVVGPGAAKRASEILGALDSQPLIREHVRAAVLVAERRWNLKLKNGLDIRLPETKVQSALEALASLEREKKILTRDLTMIDLRLPDRVTVRLSDEAAQAREQAAKDAAKKKKGGPA